MELLILVFIAGLFAIGYAAYWVCLAIIVFIFAIIKCIFGAAKNDYDYWGYSYDDDFDEEEDDDRTIT